VAADYPIMHLRPLRAGLVFLLYLLLVACTPFTEPQTTRTVPSPSATAPAVIESNSGGTSNADAGDPSTGNGQSGEPPESPLPVQGELVVSYFDVGQGDSTLLKGPDFTILIDAGRHDRGDVVPHLQSAGIAEIDLLVATHPHADHIGQIPDVLGTYPVGEVWLSGDSATSQTFERVLDAIDASDAGYHEPRAGETQVLGSALIEVVSPASVGGDLNEGSVAVRITYGDIVFLFTGDGEAGAESGMLARGHNLSAHVLQVGHHGSNTSSTQPFLSAVQPEVAIYSAGGGNQYGHPHDEVIDRLTAMGVEVYGTAEHGTIVVTTDGLSYQVTTQTNVAARAPPANEPAAVQEDTPTPPVPPPSGGGCQPGQVDINSAAPGKLEAIIHIGPARAQAVIALRPFASVDAMVRVRWYALVE
jgi:competence protein ComEC